MEVFCSGKAIIPKELWVSVYGGEWLEGDFNDVRGRNCRWK
jgi:hypothetical protein